MAAVIRKHCILTDDEIHAIVLWIIASYMIDSVRIFPKLTLISPEKRCGKTTTMEIIMSLSKDGLLASNVSQPVLFRLTTLYKPTLLIDEADRFVKGGDPNLVGIINSGHTKSGATVLRCEGESFEPRAFSTWMPMVLASIQNLDATIMDRSIVINIRRKKTSEHVHRLPMDILNLCKPIREKLLRWGVDTAPQVQANLVEPSSIGNDRAKDNWLPLFSVANQINDMWQKRCESAYKGLTPPNDLELSTELLRDIREIFHWHSGPKISTQELIGALSNDEDKPWRRCNNGKSINAHYMANTLAPYGVKPSMHRFSDVTRRGYEKALFEDAFERYL